jgi:hypothetical protein
MRYLRAAGAFALTATLAVPVAASAHPTVYTDEDGGRVVTDAGPPVVTELRDRYMVVNHGYTYIYEESNGLGAPGGVVSYALLPGAFRADMTGEEKIAGGGSGAQAHATCQNSALDDDASVLAWQDADPFYGYVPFQKASANLDDDPADWIATIEAETGIDLSAVSDDAATAATQLEALCEGAAPGGLGGDFVPADTRLNTDLTSGAVNAATAPLNDQIAGLQASLTAAQQARDSAQAALAAANAELARVMPLTRTFSATLPTARMRTGALRSDGATVTLTGPPLQAVSLRLSIPAKAAKKLGLKSGLLARTTASIGVGGSAQATLEPSARVKRALRRMRGSATLTLKAAGGDRTDTVTGRVSR